MAREPDPSPLLERAYVDLDLVAGTLLEATATPPEDAEAQRWRELGDWLLLAARVDAQRVFFVNDDPVLVFSSLPAGSPDSAVLDLYRRTWSLARPRCLFLAVGEELRVYSLSRPPATPGSDQDPIAPLDVVYRASEVAEKLANFHRERLESGAAFEDPQLSDRGGRADQQLLRDVRSATEALVVDGLTRRLAHMLIERAILVRYLEDREVLTTEYFDAISSQHGRGTDAEEAGALTADFGPPSQFIRFLNDRELAYALFEQLAHDFNGDLFVPDPNEQQDVTADHLRLLSGLLQGRPMDQQEPLFLWAYDFSVIPTNLVSTMYELFYREETDENTSTYYTPSELVEFVLTDVLTPDALERDPRVCDPACGSGIFLVEAYRRIVRHEAAREGGPLTSRRLEDLLLSRIAGCDIDEAAVRLAAFSLYIAFLNYQSPQDIRQAGPLPRLIQRPELGVDGKTPLVVGNAFARLIGEPTSGRRAGPNQALPWQMHSFQVVVGNPPWTEPPRSSRSVAEQWASERGRAIGDRNPSQLFMWRALDLLADDGVCALLVGAKAILNTRRTSKVFRSQWLQDARVEHVVNFSQVRKDFFEQGVAPFMLLRFRRANREANGVVVYETALPVPSGRRGSSALVRLERRIVSQASLRSRDYLWKTYSAGSIRDDAFLARLELEDRLRDWSGTEPKPQYGYQRGSEREGRSPSRALRRLRSLRTFESWGPLKNEWFEAIPDYVKRQPDERLYRGRRLLVRRGVSPRFGPHARLETEPFAFRHTIYGVSLDHLSAWQAKVVLGTLLSSLGRYWLYMVSGSWGTWMDEVRSEDLLNLPVRFTSASDPATKQVVRAVDSLPRVRAEPADLWDETNPQARSVSAAIREIDEGVEGLFELTTVERDLIADFWLGRSDDATKPVPAGGDGIGTVGDLVSGGPAGLRTYLKTFLGAWNRHLGDNGEFSWQVWRDSGPRVIAVVFETHAIDASDEERRRQDDSGAWSAALSRVGIQLERRQTQSILRYGTVRVVSDTAIVVVKRDEQRLWTATAAREDADATTAQVMALQGR